LKAFTSSPDDAHVSRERNMGAHVMGYESQSLGELVEQFREAARAMERSDTRFDARLDSFETSLNDLFKKAGRPGGSSDGYDGFARASAIELCKARHELNVPKDAGKDVYAPVRWLC
jgi:hypothetical protein